MKDHILCLHGSSHQVQKDKLHLKRWRDRDIQEKNIIIVHLTEVQPKAYLWITSSDQLYHFAIKDTMGTGQFKLGRGNKSLVL